MDLYYWDGTTDTFVDGTSTGTLVATDVELVFASSWDTGADPDYLSGVYIDYDGDVYALQQDTTSLLSSDGTAVDFAIRGANIYVLNSTGNINYVTDYGEYEGTGPEYALPSGGWVRFTVGNGVGAINSAGEVYFFNTTDGEMVKVDFTEASLSISVTHVFCDVDGTDIYIRLITTTGKLYEGILAEESGTFFGSGYTLSQVGTATNWVAVNGDEIAIKSDGGLYEDITVDPPTQCALVTSGFTKLFTRGSRVVNKFVNSDGHIYQKTYTGVGGTPELYDFTAFDYWVQVTENDDSGEQYALVASTSESVQELLYESIAVASVMFEAAYKDVTSEVGFSDTLHGPHIGTVLTATANAADAAVNEWAVWFYETVASGAVAGSSATVASSVTSTVAAQSVIAAMFEALVSEASSASETWFLDIGMLIADFAGSTGISSASANTNAALAEVIVAMEFAEKGLLENIGESAAAASSVANRVAAVQSVLDAATAADTATNYLIALREVSESITGTDVTALMQVLTELVSDGGEAFVSLSISGEAYTGWVLNTANNAFSEYQGLNFNSLARIGNRYFGASENGIFELTGSTDAGENIATYIQTGLMDFGTSFNKSVQYAYIAADSEGRVALGVSVSEKADVRQYWYEITTDNAAANNLKIPIGRGLKGRYWKFDIASDALESFDAVTLLPVTLSRRV